jgi:AcrR family transcriptional regulator
MDGTQDDLLPRGMALLWGIDERQRRGPRPALTIHDIGAAAVRIADEEGLAALSMSKVATALGFTTMSLYRYVDSKDDLVLAMLNEAYGAPPAGGPRTQWRPWLIHWCEANRAALVRHPWILQIPMGEPPLTPNLTGWLEEGLTALHSTELSEQEKLSSLLLAEVYVRGQVQLMGAFDTPAAKQGEFGYAARTRRVLDPDRFPHLATALASGALEDDDGGEDEFRFGLEAVLAGIDRLIEKRVAG